MFSDPTKSDWKTFQAILPELRERYLEKKNREIASLLSEPGKTSTERFWASEEKIRKEAKILKGCLDGYTKGSMKERVLIMHRHGMFLEEDIFRFSETFQAEFRSFLARGGF